MPDGWNETRGTFGPGGGFTLGDKHKQRRKPMASIPSPTPDTVEPAAPPIETPPPPTEPDPPSPPETEPTPPDIDEPGRGPDELPPERIADA
jgi:hypothetical protein